MTRDGEILQPFCPPATPHPEAFPPSLDWVQNLEGTWQSLRLTSNPLLIFKIPVYTKNWVTCIIIKIIQAGENEMKGQEGMIFLHITPVETWGDSGAIKMRVMRKCPCLWFSARDFNPN